MRLFVGFSNTVISVTSVQPCQKGRSLMLPKFLQSLASFPSNLSALQDISHKEEDFALFSFPFRNVFFSHHWKTIENLTLGFCTLSKSVLVFVSLRTIFMAKSQCLKMTEKVSFNMKLLVKQCYQTGHF